MIELLDVAPSRPAAPDQAAWADLAGAADVSSFGRAWLALASRSFEAIRRSALLANEKS